MFFNHVVVIFDSGETVSGLITGTFNENGGGIYLHADGAAEPAARRFSEMLSMTVIA